MKDLKNYLHLYLPFEFSFYEYKYKVIGFKYCGHFFQVWHEHGFFDVLKSEFKLPLRPLSDITEEEKWDVLEKIGYDTICGPNDIDISFIKKTVHDKDRFAPQVYFDAVPYLLSKHFDLFSLIEAGLAIDKTTLK